MTTDMLLYGSVELSRIPFLELTLLVEQRDTLILYNRILFSESEGVSFMSSKT